MRRALLSILLVLLPALSGAQTFVRWIPPPNVASFYETSTAVVFTKSVSFPSSSDPIRIPNGSSTAPGLTFTDQTNTGFYRIPPANYLGVVYYGNTYWRFNAGANSFDVTSDIGKLRLGVLDDVVLTRDAANTLALRNSTNAQTFNLYGTYTDSSNYHRVQFEGQSSAYGAGYAEIDLVAAGTGTTYNGLVISVAGSPRHLLHNTGHYPQSNDNMGFGQAGSQWQSAYISRSIQGSKTKALTEGAATAVTQIAVPQTAGANFADATIEWAVYASDGTDSQVRKGSTYLAAVNKAGVETCTVGDVGTTQVAVSAGTLTCTTSCITGLTDVVQFALNCTSSLTQTTLNALARLNMMQPNTVTPQ